MCLTENFPPTLYSSNTLGRAEALADLGHHWHVCMAPGNGAQAREVGHSHLSTRHVQMSSTDLGHHWHHVRMAPVDGAQQAREVGLVLLVLNGRELAQLLERVHVPVAHLQRQHSKRNFLYQAQLLLRVWVPVVQMQGQLSK